MAIGSGLFVFFPLVWGGGSPVNAFPPNNSERFFEEGREQLERNIELLEEIQDLENQSLLEIDEGVLEEFQGIRPNLELEQISEDTFVLRETNSESNTVYFK